jgi:fructose-1,6-bisphosphatase/inositol monophosphatase family enzyme
MIDLVKAVIAEAAAEAIMPRFKALGAGDVVEKSPGEQVTLADQEAERLIARRLIDLLPGSRVVGEEASSEDASLLDRLDEGDIWLVDPLDGTANFVVGSPDFAVMVALLRQGVTIASWIFQPATGLWALAERGGGAVLASKAVTLDAQPLHISDCRGSVLTRFLPGDRKVALDLHRHRFAEILPGRRCSGVDYPSLAVAEQHFLSFWRVLPWDHAPGVLFIEEAGGFVANVDGSTYSPVVQTPGLIVARDKQTWRHAEYLIRPESPKARHLQERDPAMPG